MRGIEISCARDGISVHLLGYLHDPANAALMVELERSRSSRHTRAERIVRKLSADVPITYEEVLETAAPGATVGRPHIADALVAKGVVATRDDAFADYLYTGSPYHASHYAPDPVTAVRLVNDAGGVAVMAHPFAGRRGRLVDDEVIEAMAAAGLAGLEAHHRDHTPADVAHAEEMARRLGLFVTGSSDYHGAGKVNLLGENTTSPAVLPPDRGAGVRRRRRLAVSRGTRPSPTGRRTARMDDPVSGFGLSGASGRGGAECATRRTGLRRRARAGQGRRAVDRCGAVSVTTASVLP